jgi:hypothetical protein
VDNPAALEQQVQPDQADNPETLVRPEEVGQLDRPEEVDLQVKREHPDHQEILEEVVLQVLVVQVDQRGIRGEQVQPDIREQQDLQEIQDLQDLVVPRDQWVLLDRLEQIISIEIHLET